MLFLLKEKKILARVEREKKRWKTWSDGKESEMMVSFFEGGAKTLKRWKSDDWEWNRIIEKEGARIRESEGRERERERERVRSSLISKEKLRDE